LLLDLDVIQGVPVDRKPATWGVCVCGMPPDSDYYESKPGKPL